MLLFLRICLRQYQSNIAWFLSTRDLPKQAWHNIWPRVSLCQQLDWSVYLLLYIFQTQLSICTYLHVTCHNPFHVNIMRVTTTLTPLWEVHIAFSRLQIGFASTRKVQWPIFTVPFLIWSSSRLFCWPRHGVAILKLDPGITTQDVWRLLIFKTQVIPSSSV